MPCLHFHPHAFDFGYTIRGFRKKPPTKPVGGEKNHEKNVPEYSRRVGCPTAEERADSVIKDRPIGWNQRSTEKSSWAGIPNISIFAIS